MDEVLFGELAGHSVKQSVARLNVEGDLSYLYACTKFDSQELSVTLADGKDVWSGCLTQLQLSELARKVTIKPEEFIQLTLDALCGIHSTSQFVYGVSNLNESQLKLSWKQVVGSDGIRVELGSITVHKEPNSKKAHCVFLDYLINKVSSLESEVDQLREINSCLETERKNTLLKVKKCADIKESLENDLYGKFCAVLNSKKGKIRHLLDQLSEPSSTVPSNDSEAGNDRSSAPTETETASSEAKPGPVKRRKRVAEQVRSGPLQVPHPPTLKTPSKPKSLSSEADSFESDKLLELM